MKKPVRVIMLGKALAIKDPLKAQEWQINRLKTQGQQTENFMKQQQLTGEYQKYKIAQAEQQGKENSEEIQLLKSIKQKSEFIKSNPFYGDNIKKEIIPKEYNVENLWRVELTNYWRMLYTIKGDQIEIVCFVLNIVDHERYNKIFRYRKN